MCLRVCRNSSVETVEQRLVYCGDENGKLYELRQLLRGAGSAGLHKQRGGSGDGGSASGSAQPQAQAPVRFTPPALLFVQSKERARELFEQLCEEQSRGLRVPIGVVHSDLTPEQVHCFY